MLSRTFINSMRVALPLCRQRTMSSGSSVRPVTKFLDRGDGSKLAYRQLLGDNPGIVFLPGFQSNMQGVKATALEEYCVKKGLSYVWFDYQGCGESSGDVRDATLSTWRSDCLAVIDQITAGPQILVGSSLGGLLMLYTALDRPHRIHALVGIATAADFSRRGFDHYPKEIQDQVKRGQTAVVKEGPTGRTHVLAPALCQDLPRHDILAQDIIDIKCPVHLLHGMSDHVVPHAVAQTLADKLWTQDVQLVFSKAGDHRFSQTEDILLLFETLELLVFGAKETRELAIKSWTSFTLFPQPDHLITKRKVIQKY